MEVEGDEATWPVVMCMNIGDNCENEEHSCGANVLPLVLSNLCEWISKPWKFPILSCPPTSLMPDQLHAGETLVRLPNGSMAGTSN
eukprot:COSAG03_NODE_8444_length_802_cov_1.877667_1_plen_85_part_10